MSNRNGNIDLVKCLASLLVMACHLNIFGITIESNHFSSAWIYVELYLIITGYYTAKHYDKQKNDHKLKDSISYTIEKFLPIVPYIFIVTILQYTTNGIINIVNNGVSLRDVLYSSLENFTFDMLLVSETYTTPLVGSLWYLSAMFIIFPLFSYFMQFKNRY